MKKGIFTLLIAFFSLCLNAGTIEQTYHFNAPQITASGEFQNISIEGLLNTGVPGEPALPYQAVKLLLPPGEIINSLDIDLKGKTPVPGHYKLFPVQPSRPLSQPGNGTIEINPNVYAMNNIYPATQTGNYTTAFLNGYAIGMSTFTPVQYIPATGEIYYYKEVKIVIHTQSSNKASSALRNLTNSEQALKRVQKFIQNPSLLKLYSLPAKDSEDYELLIITPAQFEPDFQDLIDMYMARGLRTQLVTKETISASGTGQDLQEKIRNFIIDEYQNHSVEYVLLGGDVEHIPYRGFYCYVQSGSGYEDSNIPADLYYSALDGNWNDDGDNRWGEPGEDDLLPDIAVARFPFSNTTELANLINKSVMYQNNPVLGEFNDAVMAGEWLYSNPDTYGSDYLELLIGYQNENGYETYGIPETYNFHKLYESVSSWSANDLRAEINAGRQFIHHVGHANSTYVAYMSNSDITDANFSGANGVDHNFTLFLSHGCICGAFDDGDCIMERMVNIQNFAVSVIGNSRYGWFNEGQTEGPSAHLHREFVDALYHEKMNHLGAAFAEAKIQTAPWVTAPGQWEEGALRWNFYDMNILGNPALSVWTAEPININTTYQNSIPVGVTSTTVTVESGGQPMENFSCVFTKDGEIYGKGITDASGNATVNFDPVFTEVGDAQLVVCGYNCLPTTYDVSIIPNDGAYVIFSAYEIDDSQGNANGQPDYDEIIDLDVEMENVGAVNAGNVMVTLSSTDPFITISDNSENYGTIPANSVLNIPAAFEFVTFGNIPDQHEVQFELEASGDEVWTSDFSIIINAPDLHIGTLVVNDLDQGNGNGILDPGETADIEVEVMNNGHISSQSVMSELSSSSPYVSISNGSMNLGSLPVNGLETASFTIELDESTPVGSTVDLGVELLCGMYGDFQMFNLPVGLIVEDFETGDFSSYDWEFGGNADWTITSNDPWEGDYAAKSGSINDQQTSTLQISMSVTIDDQISFYRKVSSEANYDYLRFYIDNVEIDSWAGEEGWEQESYPVSAGDHTFKWIYEKDYSVSNGEDCAWVDYIVFPASTGAGNPLSGVASATPPEICEGDNTQLHAYASGGSGSYSYEWTPTTGLSDPTITDPIASPLTTTTYTVTIDDGNATVSDQISVTVNPVLNTPTVSQVDDHLVSDASAGNQWYDSNGLIPGATGQTFYPAATGNYHVKVNNEFGCASEPSNVIYFVYTGINNQNEQNLFRIYPNPVVDYFSIEYTLTKESKVTIMLYSQLGTISKLLVDHKKQTNGFYKLDFHKNELQTGVYYVRLICGNTSKIEKIVITK